MILHTCLLKNAIQMLNGVYEETVLKLKVIMRYQRHFWLTKDYTYYLPYYCLAYKVFLKNSLLCSHYFLSKWLNLSNKNLNYKSSGWQIVGLHNVWITRWRHQMETFSALLALCAGKSPVTSEFPAQRPVMRSFDVFFDRWLEWIVE